jgi:hypothetical protein
MISSKRYIVILVFLTSNYPALSRIQNTLVFSSGLYIYCNQYSTDLFSIDSPLNRQNTSVANIDDDDLGVGDLKNTANSKKYKKGDTLFYCDVLKLSNQDYGGHIFAVFGYSYIKERKGRSKIRIKYILNRERNYLSKIFYSRAVKVERSRVDVSVKKYMKQLEKKYPKVRMWGVLDANAIL